MLYYIMLYYIMLYYIIFYELAALSHMSIAKEISSLAGFPIHAGFSIVFRVGG